MMMSVTTMVVMVGDSDGSDLENGGVGTVVSLASL